MVITRESESREISFHNNDIQTFRRMVNIAYFHGISKNEIVDKIIEQCEKSFAFNYFTTKEEHILLVRWMRVVWAHYPSDDFRELINDVAQLRINFPESENPAPDPVRKFLCSHCDNTGCGAFPTGQFTQCEDFNELKE